MITLRLASLLALTLVLVACPQGSSGSDTGGGPRPDAFVPGETDAFVPAELDAFVPGELDALAAPDAVGGEVDAFAGQDAPSAPDAFVAEDPDAGFRGDTGAVGAGECDPTACTPTCFRPITCVKACGGPETACGCCACATGSFDPIGCGSSM